MTEDPSQQPPREAPRVRVTLPSEPGTTPAEEAALVARVAAAVREETGQDVSLHLEDSEHVTVRGTVAERLQGSSRWSS